MNEAANTEAGYMCEASRQYVAPGLNGCPLFFAEPFELLFQQALDAFTSSSLIALLQCAKERCVIAFGEANM